MVFSRKNSSHSFSRLGLCHFSSSFEESHIFSSKSDHIFNFVISMIFCCNEEKSMWKIQVFILTNNRNCYDKLLSFIYFMIIMSTL